MLRNNLTSAFLCAQGAARIMAAHGGGRIVNIGSISGQRGSYGRTAYGVTKAGIHQMTRIMAVELGPPGIAVNAIAPGPIDTGITSMGPDQERRYLERIPLERFGHARDIAGTALFLVAATRRPTSPAASSTSTAASTPPASSSATRNSPR